MNADEYIASVRSQNKQLMGSEKIQITPKSLEMLLRRAHKVGRDDGWNAAMVFESNRPKSVFEQVFGKAG